MDRLKNTLLSVLLLLCAGALLLHPAEAGEAARQGLRLCFTAVLPALFPFFVLSTLWVETGLAEGFGLLLARVMGPLFRLSGAGAGALALGLVGGYPVGARTAAELYRGGRISREEAERLLGFCNNAGPGFLLGVCGGGVFQSPRAGLYLYMIHAAAAVLTGMLLRRREAPESAPARKPPAKRKSLLTLFPAAVRDSFAAAWSVCGYVVLFAVVLLPVPTPLRGLVELTNGVMALTPDRSGFVRCAALLGWGGLSVHAQTMSVLEDSGLTAHWYIPGKLLHCILSIPLAIIVSLCLFR